MDNESIWYQSSELRSDHKRYEYITIDIRQSELQQYKLEQEGFEPDPDWRVGTCDCNWRFRKIKIPAINKRRTRSRQGRSHVGLVRRIKN